MQAVFFLSLFSLIFLMFSSMTAGMSKNIMQENVEKKRFMTTQFKEVERALTKTIYKQKESGRSVVDLSNADYTNLGGTFLTEHTNYSTLELTKDAWGKDIKVFKVVDQTPIWGGPDGQFAKAPITSFLLLSAGSNQYYDVLNHLGAAQNATTLDANSIKTVDLSDPAVIKDDIAIRFNNYDAMLNIWQKAENLDTLVKNIGLEYYKVRLDAFSPLIQLSYRDKDNGTMKDDIFSDLTSETYGSFSDLSDVGKKESFSTDWYTTSALKDVLRGFRKPKKYTSEFELDPEVINEFNSSYSAVDFLYPSYDALIYNSNLNRLSSSDEGLRNLGLPAIKTLDSFDNVDGEVDFSYDENKGAEFYIIRKTSSLDLEKWSIDKKTLVDGLGRVD